MTKKEHPKLIVTVAAYDATDAEKARADFV